MMRVNGCWCTGARRAAPLPRAKFLRNGHRRAVRAAIRGKEPGAVPVMEARIANPTVRVGLQRRPTDNQLPTHRGGGFRLKPPPFPDSGSTCENVYQGECEGHDQAGVEMCWPLLSAFTNSPNAFSKRRNDRTFLL